MQQLFLRVLILCLTVATTVQANTLELYVDEVTKQVYTAPGPNRVRLGLFQQVTEAPAVTKSGTTAAPASTTARQTAAAAPAAPAQAGSTPAPAAPAEAKWYDKYSIRGYTQLRFNHLLDDELDGFDHPADRSVGEDQSLFIRRLRLILSGDINDHLSLYIQPDFAVTPSGSTTTHFVQLRDAYVDYAFDKKKEWRVRIGQSKIPYSFENLQSSQNRIPLDRNDATNSCCRDERDLGAFFYWAPEHIRKRFKELVASGLKGSGDYGVVALGVYNGQGANRFERNDGFHMVGRLTWPWQFANGQIFEAGVQALNGRFIPTADARVALRAPARGFQDQRYGFHAVLYPQPFGFQAEWNWGKGPELNANRSGIDVDDLHGGYVQAMYKLDTALGTFLPLLRWQYFDGAMKFERNSPYTLVDDIELGFEWQPMPALELTALYTILDRTNVIDLPYEQFEGDLLRFQLQWNY
jgi:hypothetical protein